MKSISPVKARAERQIRYRRETFFGVVAAFQDTAAGRMYDVKLAGQGEPVVNVYNAAGFELQIGDAVTVQRVGGQRFSFQIVAKAAGKPMDVQADKVGQWDCFDWDDGTVWG